MATEIDLASSIVKNRYLNYMDEAYNFICMSMYLKLLFHIEACTTLDDIWTRLECLFGKKDEMKGHMLEEILNSMERRSFTEIQGFVMNFKSLLLHIKRCGIDKSTQPVNQLILPILQKLCREYVVFSSTFHIVRFTSGATWKTPTLDKFI